MEINRDDVLKKWIPGILIVSFLVIFIGLIIGISISLIISSILISIILVVSGLFFQSIGRNRYKKMDNNDQL